MRYIQWDAHVRTHTLNNSHRNFFHIRFLDHAETITDANLDRVHALGGGIAVQNRMFFQGESFVQRYGAHAASNTPPIKKMLARGIPGKLGFFVLACMC